jgi:hypothetical protein
MDEKTYECLIKVIDYVYEDEQRHWEEEGQPDNHIFTSVRQLRDWADEVSNYYAMKVNVAGTPNALERLFNSLPEKDKRRE